MIPIVTIDQPDHQVLTTPAKPVSLPANEEITEYIIQMTETIDSLKSPYGKPAGLAAPQVGIPYQIICFQIPEEAKTRRKDVYDTYPLTFFINPTYTPLVEEGLKIDRESCYSIPNRWNEAERYFAIHLIAYTPNGGKIDRICKGFMARVLQHEIDHLQGKLCNDCLPVNGKQGIVDQELNFIENK